MSTTASPPLSEDEVLRPAWLERRSFRTRPDLVAVRRRCRLATQWIVKDPVALQYFCFGEREWFLLEQFGRHPSASPREAMQRFAARFPAQSLSVEDIKSFIVRMRADGLLIIDGARGFGQWLLAKSDRQRRNSFLAKPFQLLAIRFRGIDPDAILNLLRPVGTLLFSPLTLVLVFLSTVISVAFFASQYATITGRIPDLGAFFSGGNLVLLLISLSCIKILHELGHGLACKRYGGECHELGFMLLVFTPCLYCNVSDAWMIRSRWQRMLVSAAGIYVELILANLCFFLWYFSNPGVLNSLCLNTVLLCTLNTILVNGNPLLRYDGYYLLSDLTEQPNLAARAKTALWTVVGRWFVRADSHQVPLLQGSYWLSFFGLASLAYRTFVIGVVLWLAHKVLSAYDLDLVFYGLLLSVLGGILGPTMLAIGRVKLPEGGWRMVRGIRVLVVLAVAAGLIAVAVMLPLPYQVTAPMTIDPSAASYTYAQVDGKLVWALESGAHVVSGETIAQLENSELRLEVETLQDEIREQSLALANLQKRANLDAEVTFQIPVVKAALADLNQRLADSLEDQSRLEIKSDVSGRVLWPSPRELPSDTSRSLGPWQGIALEHENLGCLLRRGDLVAIVARPADLRALLYVPQSQVGFLAEGQRVEMRIDCLPEASSRGEIVQIVPENVENIPGQIMASGEIGFQISDRGQARSIESIYRVVVRLHNHHDELFPGSGGRARVTTAPRTLYDRVATFFQTTFTFRW